MGMSDMGRILVSASLIAMTAGTAFAGGIDRSGQGIGVIFEKGNYAELSFGMVKPEVGGNDVALFGGRATGDIAGDYGSFGLAYKADINDKLSYALILDQPFGADVRYPDVTLSGGSVALGGTMVDTSATALTALLRYKFDDRISVYGGLRAQHASGDVHLSGLAYGLVNGYNVHLDGDTGLGYTVGAAYEIPDIALRVALTYSSKIKHELNTTETFAGALAGLSGTSVTTVETPQSVNLDIQSGIAKDTLVFGQIRWVDWSDFDIDPLNFTTVTNGGSFVKGGGLVDLDDSVTYTLGVGRKFNDNWSGAFSMSYEKKGDPLVSPLSATNGKFGVTLAASYTQDNFKITTASTIPRSAMPSPKPARPMWRAPA